MNTYHKFIPNVFVAKCEGVHEKGDEIILTTKYGQEHECIVHNLVGKKDGLNLYSITRADGFDAQARAQAKADRLRNAENRADQKSHEAWRASNEGADFLRLAEPIKIGHHSEKRHRALIQRNHDRMQKSVDLGKVSEGYGNRAEYWEAKAEIINLSMPESAEYFAYKLEKAKAYHEGLKAGTIERSHSFSLTYAKKEVNELTKKVAMAARLWG